MRLFHGSEQVVAAPSLAAGRLHNDYGRGFYCTDDAELAGEWACKNRADGFVNEYDLAAEGLRVLDLLDGSWTVLHWMALLLDNRVFSLQLEAAREAREFLVRNYLVDVSEYDVVVGYRADDSYFSYAQSFVENGLPVRLLAKALQLGQLGEQVVLVSEAAFERLEFVGAQPVKAVEYYPRFKRRDAEARRTYRDDVAHSHSLIDDRFVFDIIRDAAAESDAEWEGDVDGGLCIRRGLS